MSATTRSISHRTSIFDAELSARLREELDYELRGEAYARSTVLMLAGETGRDGCRKYGPDPLSTRPAADHGLARRPIRLLEAVVEADAETRNAV